MARSRRVGDDFVEAARPLLERELRRRGLLDAPPGYLGFDDRARWSEDGTLDLLAFELGVWTLRRIDSLHAKLEVYGNIDPMMVRNVRFFLTERQQAADPVGYSTYENVRKAVKDAIEEGELSAGGASVPRPEQPIRGAGAASRAELATAEDISKVLRERAGFPALARAMARRNAEARAQLRAALAALIAAGLAVFRLEDLVEVLRGPARAAAEEGWSPRRPGTEDDGVTEASLTLIVEGLEELSARWDLEDRAAAMRAGIEALPARSNLHRTLDELLHLSESREKVSQRELARRLDLPPSTVSDYMRTLRDLWKSTSAPAVAPKQRLG